MKCVCFMVYVRFVSDAIIIILQQNQDMNLWLLRNHITTRCCHYDIKSFIVKRCPCDRLILKAISKYCSVVTDGGVHTCTQIFICVPTKNQELKITLFRISRVCHTKCLNEIMVLCAIRSLVSVSFEPVVVTTGVLPVYKTSTSIRV